MIEWLRHAQYKINRGPVPGEPYRRRCVLCAGGPVDATKKQSGGLGGPGPGAAWPSAYPDVERRAASPEAVFPAAVFPIKALIPGQDGGQ